VAAAFAAVYILWGSTYLAIRFGVESIPPFIMAASRFLVAGALLFTVSLFRGARLPTLRQWRDGAVAGGLMLMIGNGGVTWAEQVIPSAVTALLVALVPMDWLRPGGVRPRMRTIAGLTLGFIGVALLARDSTAGHGAVYAWGVVALMLSSVGWAFGSIFNRHADKPSSPLMAVAVQMLSGGALLGLTAAGAGEMSGFSLAGVTGPSVVAWLYLTVAGSLIGFTAYVWLLQVSTPERVSTYAYVNPLIAVVLGCTIGREPVSGTLFTAGGLIIAAVVVIVRSGAKSQRPQQGRWASPGVVPAPRWRPEAE
jgi:drug/metabolite transporter (DMT)-like permease